MNQQSLPLTHHYPNQHRMCHQSFHLSVQFHQMIHLLLVLQNLQVHLQYFQELNVHDSIRVHLQLLDFDEKRLHFFEYMYHAEKGYLAATSEQLAIHVDMKTRKSASFSANALEKIRAVHKNQRTIQRPKAAGKSIGLKKSLKS